MTDQAPAATCGPGQTERGRHVEHVELAVVGEEGERSAEAGVDAEDEFKGKNTSELGDSWSAPVRSSSVTPAPLSMKPKWSAERTAWNQA